MTHRPFSSLLRRSRDRIRRRGFALIVTISLMVLLSLLAIGLLGLSTVSLRASASSKAAAEARANARLALRMAIAELQKTAGDDRRITADGALLTDSPRARAVGVWKSWSPDMTRDPANYAPNYEDSRSSNFVRWLISGDPATRSEMSWIESDQEEGESIEIFREQADGFQLAARALPLADGESRGSLAWAVMQENTRAKINVAGPESDQIVANDQLQAQPRPQLSLSERLLQPEGGWNRRAFSVLNYRQAALDEALWRGPESTAGRADFTAVSAGLLTDVLSGGLKTDLSLGFELDDSDFNTARWSDDGDTLPNPFLADASAAFDVPASYDGQRPLYRPLSDSGTFEFKREYWPANVAFSFPVTGAPTFHSLRDHYRIPHHLYRTADGLTAFERPADHTAAEAVSPGRGFFPPPYATYEGDRTRTGIRPVLDRAMFLISGGLSDNDELRIVLTPIVTLWNPYNVALEIEGSVAHVWIDMPYDFQWRTYASNGRLASNDYMYMSGLMGKQFTSQGHARSVDPYFYAAITADGEPVGRGGGQTIRFAPGEVRVFAPALRELVDYRVTGSVRDRTIFLRPVDSIDQFSTRGGFSIPTRNAARNEGFVRQLEPDRAAQLSFGANTFQGEDYPFYITLEDATRARTGDPDESVRGQVVADVLANNFARTGEIASFLSPRIPYARLKAEPVPIGVIEAYHRVARSGGEAQVADLVFTGNPRQPWMNPFITRTSFRTGPQYQTRMRPVSSFNGVLQTADGGRSAYYGASQTPNGGRSQLSFFELPSAPLLSLAGFQHADLSGTPFAPANQLGNSWASAYVPRNRAATDALAVDHCYLLNEALWDGWFLSGAAPGLDHPSRSGSPQVWEQTTANREQSIEDLLQRFFENPDSHPLRNPRLRPAAPVADPAALAAELAEPAGCLKLAAHLLVDGAFNVNSTSIEAWKAVLTGLRGASFEVDGATTDAGDRTPVPRFRDPVGEANDPWHGFRTLDDSQINALAEEIVAEVRTRGPFLSLGEFINRRISDDELGLKGALQAAIDRAGLNEDYLVDEFDTSAYDRDARQNITPADTGVGTPGYLTQADLLQSLAPTLTVRSDTFTIRAYGDSRDTSGRIVARAWAEATVQREADFVDPADEAHHPIDELRPVNARFGRRFRTTSFRFLSEAELRG